MPSLERWGKARASSRSPDRTNAVLAGGAAQNGTSERAGHAEGTERRLRRGPDSPGWAANTDHEGVGY